MAAELKATRFKASEALTSLTDQRTMEAMRMLHARKLFFVSTLESDQHQWVLKVSDTDGNKFEGRGPTLLSATVDAIWTATKKR